MEKSETQKNPTLVSHQKELEMEVSLSISFDTVKSRAVDCLG
jgi:hypothetical protein